MGKYLQSGDGESKISSTEPESYYPPPNNEEAIKTADQVIVAEGKDMSGVSHNCSIRLNSTHFLNTEET